ncbi:hypothetical protein [Noviherbaspirillum sedimenti]|uniref:hypothetical protein n=1 Tax=Noviherbaspirillum sedimenti TaxID=2320865 RepID=UPI0013144788|nr:hypothetical protein [Noviherbaspirillum sedimenti]
MSFTETPYPPARPDMSPWASHPEAALRLHRAPIPEEEPLPGEEPGPDEEEPPPHPDPTVEHRRPAAEAAGILAQDRRFQRGDQRQ